MPVNWTKEQQQVIDARGKDLLVSAAAGSGKTAVLVARILKRITDEEHPIDIDRLLVVTFTNAAASQMRQRIRDALSERALREPENAHLQRQLVLVQNAKIMTIHSFCLQVLRNHFQAVSLDPSFRIADEGEEMLLEQDTVKEVVDEAYEQEDAGDFTEFLEQFATGKGDDEVEEIILQLYHFALGQPFPDAWLHQCARLYENTSPGGFTAKDAAASYAWIAFLESDTAVRLCDIREQLLKALAITREPDGPYPYEKALLSDLRRTETLMQGTSYASYAEAFRQMDGFERLGAKRDARISEEKRQQVLAMRKDCRERLLALKEQYYYEDPEVLWEEYVKSGTVIRELTRLTELFMTRLSKKKAEKNVLDFSDLEHLALKVLMQEDPDCPETLIPTAVAKEYAQTFEEVMTDEYQDSNLVQELILKSVSGKGSGAHNRFMVGDVKQSIYRFRQARPELFLEKFHRYRRKEETMACRIDLHQNFRSRPEVLKSVNGIFAQIMTEPLGGIRYDRGAMLYPGAAFPEPAAGKETKRYRTELLLAEGKNGDPSVLSGTIREAEARMVGRRIRELIGSLPVLDQESGALRPARYGDIVILLRTVSGWVEVFSDVFRQMGIPCYTGSQKGYFSAAEVRIVLSYLKILDNPLQDIPLAAVLRSEIGKCSDEELSAIRLAGDSCGASSFYDCCRMYLSQGEGAKDSDGTGRKLRTFFAAYEDLRAKSEYTPVHRLIWELLDVTGYGAYAAALPAGRQRKANLDMLVEKAIAYEAGSYRGLYHFVRYIENIQKYEVDYGEANLGSEADNRVRILSIHKSKGLEFPIVFLSGLGKAFNESESRSRVVMHPEWGIACDAIRYPEGELPRMRQATLLKKTIQQQVRSENLGEEIRILYVAMTRAREKLILTGGTRDCEKKMPSWQAIREFSDEEALPYSRLLAASTALDWIVPAFLRSEGEERIRVCPACVDQAETFAKREEKIPVLRTLLEGNPDRCHSARARDYLKQCSASFYPYESALSLPGKLTVSELKRLPPEREEDAQELYPDETLVPLVPKFRQREGEERADWTERGERSGAVRGTIYHSFMEYLDYSREEELQLQLEELVSCGKMSREEAAVIRLEDIAAFLQSDIGQRMKRAALAGRLSREQPFVLGVPSSVIYQEEPPQTEGEEEMILVQGIIDAYFTEEDRIILVDYKTDRVSDGAELAGRYQKQMEYYARALTQLRREPLSDAVLYSFCLHEEIHLPLFSGGKRKG